MFTCLGQRKYLSCVERPAFHRAAKERQSDVYLFCRALLETGCRISEALNLRRQQLDCATGYIFFETLKKRRKGVYRAVPISADFSEQLVAAYGLLPASQLLWTWSRMTGYRHVRSAMMAAGISGPQASPKGLRHGFAVSALEVGIPMHLVQRWLGHARQETTAIYADLVSLEERAMASRLWTTSPGLAAELNRHVEFVQRSHQGACIHTASAGPSFGASAYVPRCDEAHQAVVTILSFEPK